MGNELLTAYLLKKYRDQGGSPFDVGVSNSTAAASAPVVPEPAETPFQLEMADLPQNQEDPLADPLLPAMGEEPPQMPEVASTPPVGGQPPIVTPNAPSTPQSAPNPSLPAPVANPPGPVPVGPTGVEGVLTDKFSPEAREKLVADSAPGGRQLAGEALAGLGDAITNSFGGKAGGSRHLEQTIEGVNSERDRKLKTFDAGRTQQLGNYELARQIVSNNRADVDRATMTDPNSPVSKAQQALLDRIEPGVDHSKITALQAEVIAKPMLEGYKISEQGKNRKMMTEYIMDKKDEETGTKFEQEMNASKARAGALGDNQKRLNASERVLNLIEQVNRNPSAMQTPEVAQAVASLVGGGGGVVSQQQIEHLMPQSFKGNVNKFIGWLTNDPVGLDQQKFITSFMHTAERERDLINRQMTIAQAKSASGYMDWAKRNPESARAKMEAQGIPEPMIKKIMSGDFKGLDAIAPTRAPALPKMPMHGDANPNEVRRQTSDGRIIVYDATTKQPLREEKTQ